MSRRDFRTCSLINMINLLGGLSLPFLYPGCGPWNTPNITATLILLQDSIFYKWVFTLPFTFTTECENELYISQNYTLQDHYPETPESADNEKDCHHRMATPVSQSINPGNVPLQQLSSAKYYDFVMAWQIAEGRKIRKVMSFKHLQKDGNNMSLKIKEEMGNNP